MSNLYDLEYQLAERKRDLDRELRRDLALRRLPQDTPRGHRAGRRTLRIRFGQMLIRLGSRLAA